MPFVIKGQSQKCVPMFIPGIANLQKNINGFFLIVMGCIVFLMQCGFAFLEAGSVR